MLLTIITFYILSIWYFNNLENQILEQQTNTTENLISVYLENEDGDYVLSETTNFDQGTDYVFNEEKSYCVNESVLSYNEETSKISVTASGTDNCYVYFDEYTPVLLSDQILMNEEDDEGNTFSSVDDATTYINSKTTPTFSSAATIDEGIFATSDNDGISYYFRGATEDNYVEFAGMLWRIIRIDGLGNIKLMLYNEDSEATSYQEYGITRSYNVTFNSATSTANYNEGTGSNDAKTIVEAWYEENLTDYSDYLATTNYCIDIEIIEEGGDIDSRYYYAYYGGYYRLYSNKTPSLICNYEEIEEISKYESIVGLISADEISFAGGVLHTINSGYYLNTNYDYLSITPLFYEPNLGNYYNVFMLDSTGRLIEGSVLNESESAVFPTVSLSYEINFTEGSGIKADPYVVG